jgi:hypothetical protein
VLFGWAHRNAWQGAALGEVTTENKQNVAKKNLSQQKTHLANYYFAQLAKFLVLLAMFFGDASHGAVVITTHKLHRWQSSLNRKQKILWC